MQGIVDSFSDKQRHNDTFVNATVNKVFNTAKDIVDIKLIKTQFSRVLTPWLYYANIQQI